MFPFSSESTVNSNIFETGDTIEDDEGNEKRFKAAMKTIYVQLYNN
jgi:hypothetical protein